jgi:hypothetical protein
MYSVSDLLIIHNFKVLSDASFVTILKVSASVMLVLLIVGN